MKYLVIATKTHTHSCMPDTKREFLNSAEGAMLYCYYNDFCDPVWYPVWYPVWCPVWYPVWSIWGFLHAMLIAIAIVYWFPVVVTYYSNPWYNLATKWAMNHIWVNCFKFITPWILHIINCWLYFLLSRSHEINGTVTNRCISNMRFHLEHK